MKRPGSGSFGSRAIVSLAGTLALVSVGTASASGQGRDTDGGIAAMRIAAQEAKLAAGAPKLADAREHLQLVLNCLEGQHGPAYRPVTGNPCTGAGFERGPPAGSANHVRVQKAIRLAAVGVTFHDFKPAHFTALAVQAVLEEGTR